MADGGHHAGSVGPGALGAAPRRQRVDARRNMDAVLNAAKAVFATSGVDAPAKEITDLAGVGVGTLYRHFPKRSDLVKAVLEQEIETCAEAGPALSEAHEPEAALEAWLDRYTDFLATKDGLATALHSGGSAFADLRDHIVARLSPTLGSLLDRAVVSGHIRPGIGSAELLYAVAKLCMPVDGDAAGGNHRMVALLVDGLRYGAERSRNDDAGEGVRVVGQSLPR